MRQGHISVLQEEVVAALQLKADGIYVDATFGAGGHSRAILAKLQESGRLYAFDADKSVEIYVPADGRVCFIHQNFCHLQRYLRLHQVREVDGIIADLGLSSMQLDSPSRGFSAQYAEGDLDMRMNLYQELRARDWLQQVGREELSDTLFNYGDLANARRLAKVLLEFRERQKLLRVADLTQALKACVYGNPKRFYAKVFQAIRMAVNGELAALQELLQQAEQVLARGGRLAIISFHSGEDRLVKHFLRKSEQLQPVNKKPIRPSAAEIRANRRSRSAKLRVAEKL